jgi:hypothetical protein
VAQGEGPEFKSQYLKQTNKQNLKKRTVRELKKKTTNPPSLVKDGHSSVLSACVASGRPWVQPQCYKNQSIN